MNQELRIMVIKNKVKSTIRDSLFMIHSKGFTLIELLVAIGIIGILSSFLLANFVGVRQRARDGVRKSDLRQIQSALELYRADKGGYSETFPACASQFDDGGGPNVVVYMKKIPCDPSSSANYQYYSATGIAYCLRTCLENKNDGDRDEVKYTSDNPTIAGCTLSACTGDQRSYTLQNP